MRKLLPILAVAAAAALTTPAFAYNDRYANDALPLAGVAVGTVAGVGAYNGWWGSGALASALPTTVAGAVAVGGVAGIGTIALIDAAVQPCAGFHALFGLNRGECANGVWVGDRPQRRVMR